MPPLETERLLIRPLAMGDLPDVCRLFAPDAAAEEWERWLQWTVLSYEQLARLHQPPYGERAIVLRSSAELIGAVGFVPCLDAFAQMPHLGAAGPPARSLNSTEFGLFWHVHPDHRGQGLATEAARAMIQYAFEYLHLHRIIATTTYDNFASRRVMEKLGMQIEQNPLPEPPWLQVVGLLGNPAGRS